jgi:hypothetical protein
MTRICGHALTAHDDTAGRRMFDLQTTTTCFPWRVTLVFHHFTPPQKRGAISREPNPGRFGIRMTPKMYIHIPCRKEIIRMICIAHPHTHGTLICSLGRPLSIFFLSRWGFSPHQGNIPRKSVASRAGAIWELDSLSRSQKRPGFKRNILP